jgi:AraC-like DNA-binding protein
MARTDAYDGKQWAEMARRAHFRCKQLCFAMCISQRQLERYTKQLFGCSPRDWLNAERIKLATCLLKENQSIKAVCFELGFKQPSHFSRKFKCQSGISPSKFVAQNKNLDQDNGSHPQVQLDFNFMSRLDNNLSRLDK